LENLFDADHLERGELEIKISNLASAIGSLNTDEIPNFKE
jgi:hypothetical protein